MNTKSLWITVIISTMFIFGANHYMARGKDMGKVKISTPHGVGEPTCSVSGTFFGFNPLRDGDSISCGSHVIICDRGVKADIEVFDEDSGTRKGSISVGSGQKVVLSCENGELKVKSREPWMRKYPGGKKRGSMKTTRTPAATDEPKEGEMITDTTWVRLLEGDAGIEDQTLIVATGEAQVQSFCTGDIVRLVGPSTLKLPNCGFHDVSGRWQGAYARRLQNRSLQPVRFTLNIRQEQQESAIKLQGEIQTPDGIFTIIEGSYSGSGSNLSLRAASNDRSREIQLYVNPNKGDTILTGTENYTTASSRFQWETIGFAERLYIAEYNRPEGLPPDTPGVSSGGLPIAVLNEPYSHTLEASSPGAGPITFRVAGGRLPRGITLNEAAGTLSGTASELGSFDIVVAASDAGGNTFEQPLTLVVKKLAVTTRLLPDAFVGRRYAATLKAIGGQPPYRWQSFLAPGWLLDPNTGELTVTPTHEDTGSGGFLLVVVTDSGANREMQLVSLQVRGLTILNSHFLPEATIGVPYRMQFQTKGNSAPVEWRIVEGDIRSIGLQLDPQTGELSGTPAKSGNFLVTVSAEEQFGSHSRDFILTVSQPGAVGRSRRRP